MSSPNVHSYGYEMNSMGSGAMTARASDVAAAESGASAWPMSRPDAISRSARPLATNACQSSIEAAPIWRYRTPSRR